MLIFLELEIRQSSRSVATTIKITTPIDKYISIVVKNVFQK